MRCSKLGGSVMWREGLGRDGCWSWSWMMYGIIDENGNGGK